MGVHGPRDYCRLYSSESIPFALILARRWGASDLRRVGSGNLGAANVMRASGVTAGVIVAALDMAKGAASVWLAERLGSGPGSPPPPAWAAIVGHIYPVWLRFRGGKGVATACGVFAVLTPLALPPALAIFAAVVWLTKYISLGSVLASLALPPLAYALAVPRRPSRRRSPQPRSSCSAIDRTSRACGPAPSAVSERGRSADRRRLGAGVGAPRSPFISAASATTCGCGHATPRWSTR